MEAYRNIFCPVTRVRESFKDLQSAVAMGDIKIVRYLIEKQVCFDYVHPGSACMTPIAIACQHGHLEIVKLLYKSGTAVDVVCMEEGPSPLYVAACFGRVEFVQWLLLDIDAVVDEHDEEAETALKTAACRGYLQIVRLLIAAGADASCKTKFGDTARKLSARNGCFTVLRYLVEHEIATVMHVMAEFSDVRMLTLAKTAFDNNVDLNAHISACGHTRFLLA